MDVREKLLELIAKAKYICANDYSDHTEDEYIADTLLDNGVTVQELDGCEYCNGLPLSQMENFTMPNAAKKDYDIVTIRFCPMCGRRLSQPTKGE